MFRELFTEMLKEGRKPLQKRMAKKDHYRVFVNGELTWEGSSPDTAASKFDKAVKKFGEDSVTVRRSAFGKTEDVTDMYLKGYELMNRVRPKRS